MKTINVLHPWHGAHYGDKAPQTVTALIEISQGSRTKYEIDKKTGLLKLDRVIYSSFHYPVNYGFIPQTLGLDNDPLDILVISSQSIQPLCLVEATVIGNMQMIDTGDKDDKIIAVAAKDPSVNHIKEDRKSTRLNSSHLVISYAVFCLKKKKMRIPVFRELARLIHRNPLKLTSDPTQKYDAKMNVSNSDVVQA